MSRSRAFKTIPNPGGAIVRVGDQGWAQQAANRARQAAIDVDVRSVGTNRGSQGNWFRDQAKKAQELFQSTMSAPATVVGTTLGLGTAAAAFGLANNLENRARQNTAPARTKEEAQRKAQQQFDAYKQAAENAASAMDELDYAQRSEENTFQTVEELRSEEARQNMFLGIQQKVLDQNFNEIRRQQPYLSASRFRESMPQMAATRAAVTQSIINSVGQGYR